MKFLTLQAACTLYVKPSVPDQVATNSMESCKRFCIGTILFVIALLFPHEIPGALICLIGSVSYNHSEANYTGVYSAEATEAKSCRVICLKNDGDAGSIYTFIYRSGSCEESDQTCGGVTSDTECLGLACCNTNSCNEASTASCNPLNQPSFEPSTTSTSTTPRVTTKPTTTTESEQTKETNDNNTTLRQITLQQTQHLLLLWHCSPFAEMPQATLLLN